MQCIWFGCYWVVRIEQSIKSFGINGNSVMSLSENELGIWNSFYPKCSKIKWFESLMRFDIWSERRNNLISIFFHQPIYEWKTSDRVKSVRPYGAKYQAKWAHNNHCIIRITGYAPFFSSSNSHRKLKLIHRRRCSQHLKMQHATHQLMCVMSKVKRMAANTR